MHELTHSHRSCSRPEDEAHKRQRQEFLSLRLLTACFKGYYPRRRR